MAKGLGQAEVTLTHYEMGVILLAIRDRAYGGPSEARTAIRAKLVAARRELQERHSRTPPERKGHHR